MNHVTWPAIETSHGLLLRYLELGGVEREDAPEMQPVLGRLMELAPINRFVRSLAEEIGKRIDECSLEDLKAAWTAHGGALPPTDEDMEELLSLMEESDDPEDEELFEGAPEGARFLRVRCH